MLLQEAKLYTTLPNGYGKLLKGLLRGLALRDHIAGLQMIGEDLPQKANRVDLDPAIRDLHGFPVPRITYSSHPFELAASRYFQPRLTAVCTAAPHLNKAAQAVVSGLQGQAGNPLSGTSSTAHIMGTARMGSDPETSVVDPYGRLHELDNVYVGDASVFTSSGGFNPTLTLMALSLRMARHIGG
jgi:gluconate 2-dehydrogenase alpha chain